MILSAQVSRDDLLRALRLVRRPFKKQSWVWLETGPNTLHLIAGDAEYQARYSLPCKVLTHGAALLLDSKVLERSFFDPKSPWREGNTLCIKAGWGALSQYAPPVNAAALYEGPSTPIDYGHLHQLLPFVQERKNGHEESSSCFVHLSGPYAYATTSAMSARLSLRSRAECLVVPRAFLAQLKKPGWVEQAAYKSTGAVYWRYYEDGSPLSFFFVQGRRALPFTSAQLWGEGLRKHQEANPTSTLSNPEVPVRRAGEPRLDRKHLHTAQAFAGSHTIENTAPLAPVYLWRDDGSGVCIMPLRKAESND